ncbi:MAG: hypothetical protein K5768_06785 [Firmicutes bacterium]|nr:hypothetical protein [Bacillota bacterium]
MFWGAFRRYTRIKKLTPKILNELIGKSKFPKLKFHYNYIGIMKISNLEQNPHPTGCGNRVFSIKQKWSYKTFRSYKTTRNGAGNRT